MAEAGPSDPTSARAIDAKEGQDGDKPGKKFSQSKSNSRGRPANYYQNPRPKPSKVQVERESAGNDSDRKPKNRSNPRHRHNAKQQGEVLVETVLSQTKEEHLKPDMKFAVDKSNPDRDLSLNSKRQGGKKQYPKGYKSYSDSKSRPNSSRGQQFSGNYSKMKPALGRESVDATTSPPEASVALQPSGVLVTNTPRPSGSYGVVSSGVYVPKNKLRSTGQGSHKHFMENQTDLPRNQNTSKRFDYSYYVGGASKQSSNERGKMAATFQAVSINVHGQSSVQAGVLIEQLTDEKYECMVCCEVIRCSKAVWSCSNCFHIFHLYCIKRWARSPTAAIEGKIILTIV